MTNHIAKAVVAAALAAVVLSACSDEKGTPTTAPPPPTGTSDSSSTALPPRPAELKLNSVDPCKVLTADQMKQIKVATTESDEGNVVDKKPSPLCHYDNGLDYGYEVGLVTHSGISYWRNGGTVESKSAEIAGYAAVEVKFAGTSNVDCLVAVDVADGQQLTVSYRPLKRNENQEQLCEKAGTAASLAIATLKTLK